MKCHCDMKGLLSYLILWNLSKKNMTGAEIAKELEKRKGTRPSPGTIYPALKELRNRGLINPEKIDEIPQGDETHQADIKMTTTIVDSKSG